MDKTVQACMAISRAKARMLDKFPARKERMGVPVSHGNQKTDRSCAIAGPKMAAIFAAAGVATPVKKK